MCHSALLLSQYECLSPSFNPWTEVLLLEEAVVVEVMVIMMPILPFILIFSVVGVEMRVYLVLRSSSCGEIDYGGLPYLVVTTDTANDLVARILTNSVLQPFFTLGLPFNKYKCLLLIVFQRGILLSEISCVSLEQ